MDLDWQTRKRSQPKQRSANCGPWHWSTWLWSTLSKGTLSRWSRFSGLVAMLCAALLFGGFGTFGNSDDKLPARLDRYGDRIPIGANQRLGTVRLRTEQRAMSIAFSQDGRQLISADWNSNVQTWDVKTGQETDRLDLGKQPDSAVISSDGSHLIVNRFSGVSLRKLPGGEVVFSNSEKQGNNRNFALSDDASMLASFPLQEPARLWDAATGIPLLKFKPEYRLNTGCFSPSGQFLAVCGSQGALQIWDLHAGRIVLEPAPNKRVQTERVQFVDENSVVCCGTRQTDVDGKTVFVANVEMWRLDNPTQPTLFQMDNEEVLGGWMMALSRDRSLLATTHYKKVIVWSVANKKPTRIIEHHDSSSSHCVSISPDNRLLVLGGANHKLMIWNLETGEQELPQSETHHGGILSIVQSPLDGKLVSTGEEGTTRWWETSTGNHLAILQQNSGWTRDAQFFSDGRHVAICSEFYDPNAAKGFVGKAAIIKLSTGELVREWILSSRGMKIAVNNQGSLAAIAVGSGISFGDEPPPEIQVWDLDKYEIVAKLSGVMGSVSTIKFETDTLIRFTTDYGAFDWNTNLAKAKEHYVFRNVESSIGESKMVRGIRFSPDDKTLIVSMQIHSRSTRKSTGRLMALNAADLKELWSTSFSFHVASEMAVSPDGHILAVNLSATSNEFERAKLELLNLNTGEKRISYDLDTQRVRSMSFSLDGKNLFTGMDRGDILSWDVSGTKSSAKEIR